MLFRNVNTGEIENVEPGTKLHTIYSRSKRWEPVTSESWRERVPQEGEEETDDDGQPEL